MGGEGEGEGVSVRLVLLRDLCLSCFKAPEEFEYRILYPRKMMLNNDLVIN